MLKCTNFFTLIGSQQGWQKRLLHATAWDGKNKPTPPPLCTGSKDSNARRFWHFAQGQSEQFRVHFCYSKHRHLQMNTQVVSALGGSEGLISKDFKYPCKKPRKTNR